MKNRTNLAVAVAVGAGALAIALAGCGVGGGGSSAGSSAAAAKAGRCDIAANVSSADPLKGAPSGEITFQTTALKQDFSPYFESVIAGFEKKYPGTTVKWQDDPGDATFTQRLVTDAQACTLPDVVNLNQTTAYALYRENFLMDLDTKAPTAGDLFIPSLWDSLTFPGTKDHYVMPWYWGLTGLQTYNADLMTKAGLDPAAPPKTVAEQFDAAEQIAAKSGGKFYAFSANPSWRLPSDWQLMKVKIVNDDESAFTFASDPKAVNWVTRMADLYKKGALPKDTISSGDDPTALYSQGRMVWGSTNASSLRYVQDDAPQVYAVTRVGSLLDEFASAMEDGQLISVPSTSKNPVTALAFANYLLSPEIQEQFISDPRIQNFPSTASSLTMDKLTKITGTDALAKANLLAVGLAKDAKNVFIYNWSDAVNTAVIAQVQLAMVGKKTPQQALDDAQAKANDILKQAN